MVLAGLLDVDMEYGMVRGPREGAAGDQSAYVLGWLGRDPVRRVGVACDDASVSLYRSVSPGCVRTRERDGLAL